MQCLKRTIETGYIREIPCFKNEVMAMSKFKLVHLSVMNDVLCDSQFFFLLWFTSRKCSYSVMDGRVFLFKALILLGRTAVNKAPIHCMHSGFENSFVDTKRCSLQHFVKAAGSIMLKQSSTEFSSLGHLVESLSCLIRSSSLTD